MRNMTTLGGNVARVFPWNDFPVALLALGAELVIAGESSRAMDADTYFKGQPARHYQPGDLLTEIRVPVIGIGQGFAYHKETIVNMDFSLLTLSASLTMEKRTVTAVRIAAGAGLPLPARLTALEDALHGRPLSTDLVKEAVAATVGTVKWKGSDGFSDAYIQQLATVHLEDVLLAAWRAAKGGVA
jgi:CO/xanthine dehydrogenase FAD-binding subunit